MAKMVGLSRAIKIEWLNKVVSLVNEGMAPENIKDALNDYIGFEISSPDNIRKSRDILMNLWVYPFEDEKANLIRKQALEAIKNGNEDKLAMHWCMLLLYYPVFVDVTGMIGKLSSMQDSFSLAWLKYYEYFAKVEHVILNSYGCEVSGGERAEFNLLQEINDAYQYDMLLIDEPESSFDNIFLKERVNHIIKEISQQMPVVIVTHNSTVGASIHPDFVINTVRTIIGKEAHYDVFYGEPGNKELVNCAGDRISNLEAMLNCLEAGEIAYDERRREYEMLKN